MTKPTKDIPKWIPEPAIPYDELIDRGIYRIRSRNLGIGVCRASGGGQASTGFIGVREKFDSRYLFEEYLNDEAGGVLGTVTPLEFLGMLPDDIEVKESVDTGCSRCGAPTEYRKDIKKRMDEAGLKLTDPGYEWPWVCENRCGPDENGRYPGGSRKDYEPLLTFMEGLEYWADVDFWENRWDSQGFCRGCSTHQTEGKHPDWCSYVRREVAQA